jgi:hypothetical protein
MPRMPHSELVIFLISLFIPIAGWGANQHQGSITLVGGEVVLFEATEGEPVLVRDLRLGPEWYALTLAKKDDKITASLVKAISAQQGLHLNSVAQHLSPGSPIVGSLISTYSLNGLLIDEPSSTDGCCVSCGKVTVCGGSVTMSCGSCGSAENNTW